jgi:hypothetical protein
MGAAPVGKSKGKANKHVDKSFQDALLATVTTVEHWYGSKDAEDQEWCFKVLYMVLEVLTVGSTESTPCTNCMP